jgi:serine/threonine protein kinase
MALSPGTKLGPYEVVAPIGAGGMGEVYRAKDARLDRSVAIKILPIHLCENAEAKQPLTERPVPFPPSIILTFAISTTSAAKMGPISW